MGWRCYPQKKGLVTSLIYSINSIGQITSSIFSSYWVNPNNDTPSIIVSEGAVTYKYYDPSIANRVPTLFMALASIQCVIFLFSLVNIWIPEEHHEFE